MHLGAVVGSLQLQCYITGRRLIAKSFACDRCFTKICPGPSTSWSLVPKIKKLLNDSLDLTWWPRGGKKQYKRTEWQIYAASSGFRRWMCQRWHLARAFETACGPLAPEGCSLTENSPFGGFSADLYRPNQLAAVEEFWFLADLVPYSPLLYFSTGSILQPKG